jgi:hypothetical protein
MPLPCRLLFVWLAFAVCGCTSLWTIPDDLSSHHLTGLHLRDGAGQSVPLQALLDRAQVTVFVFWSAACPTVVRYQRRVDDIAVRWRREGVQVLAIASNAGETPADVEAARRAWGFQVPVWHDPGGMLSEALDVETTPTAVIVSPDGVVSYRGWIDNERQPGDPEREPWLEEALVLAVVGSRPGEVRPAWGCRIVREDPRATPASLVEHTPSEH